MVGSTDEVVVRPVQQVRIVVVAPSRHLELPHRVAHSLCFDRVDFFAVVFVGSLVQGVLSNWFVFEEGLLKF